MDVTDDGLRVVPPHSFTFLFVFGLIFAAADAFGIGSNDVANAFATSVGSGSLSLRAACSIAVVTEFAGAMLLGEHVAKTIKGAWRPCAVECRTRRRENNVCCCALTLARLQGIS
jgi:phosphate/sulfate permease